MAVAEAKKIEKPESGENSSAWLSGPLGNVPRKWNQARTFLAEVRSELKKVTWPARPEVYTTTIVVIATAIVFGFYLWGLDLFFFEVLSRALGALTGGR